MLAVEPEESARMVVDAIRACFFKRPANRSRRVGEMPSGWCILGCRDKRGRNCDLDVPFRILSITTLLSTAHHYTWLSEAPSMEYRGVSRLWARVRCARTFPEVTDETGI